MNLAIHNLLQDKLRFLLSVTGVAMAVMLILFLLGLREGMFQATAAYLDHAPGSVAVMPAGVKSTSAGSGQFLSPETVAAVSSAPGVARATPVIWTMVIPELHGQKQVIKLVGYDPALGGGPWDLTEGREPSADNEVAVDRVLADRHDISLGDSLDLGGHQLTVVGLSNESASISGSLVFARREAADRVLWLEDGQFRDIGRLAVDPVCGMSVEMDSAFRLERDGRDIYFCSRGCRAEFEAGETGVQKVAQGE